MAKITTGQTYGTVDRRTSQRLTGGVEQSSSPGALAQREMAVPGLQAQANPTTSFIQSGAPTLGGPVRVPDLPRLPEPPQDAAALAKALGGFSPALAGIAESFMQREKAMDEERKQEAATFVFEAGKYGAFTGLANLQRNLERRAPTDPGAAKQLQYLLSRHPGMRRYIDDAVQRQAILGNVSNLDNAAKLDPLVDDGFGRQVRLSSLPPNSSGYQAWARSQIYTDRQYSPQVLMETQQLVASVMGGDIDRQEKAHVTFKMGEWRSNAASDVGATAKAYRAGQISAADAAARLQALIDDQRLVGVNQQTRQELVQGLWGAWSGAMTLAAPEDSGPLSWDVLLAPFANLYTGPVEGRVKADGTPNEKQLLISQLGGDEWLLKARNEHTAQWLQRHGQQEQLAQVQVREQVNAWFAELLPADVIDSSPLLAEQRLEQLRQRIDTQVDPNQRGAAHSLLDQLYNDRNRAYNAREQQMKEESLNRRMQQAAMDPAEAARLRTEINGAIERREVSATWGNTALATLTAYGREDARSYGQQLRTLMSAVEQDWIKWAKTSGSYGGGGEPSLVENQMLARAKALMSQRGNDLIQKAIREGKTPDQITNELNQLFTENNFGLRKDTPAPEVPVYQSPEDWRRRNTGWFDGSGDPGKNQQLQRDARSDRPLYPPDVLMRQLDVVLSGGKLDDATKLMIKRSGMKPGQFFINELRKHGRLNGADQGTLQRLQQLDAKEDLLSQAPQPAPQGPWVNPWTASIRNLAGLGDLAMNALVPPAAAGTMPPGVGRYVAVTGFGYSADRQTQTLHGIQGQPGYDRNHGVGNDHVHHGAKDNATALRLARYLRYLGYPVTEFAQWRSSTGGHQDPGHGTGSSFDIPVPVSKHAEVIAAIDTFYRGGQSAPAAPAVAATRRGGGMTGYATYYSGSGGSDGVAGGLTANGERYNPQAMTAAVQRSLRGKYLNKWLLVENLDTGNVVRVWANDVGSMGGTNSSLSREDPRIIDLSPAAFRRLFGGLGAGKGRIRVKIDPVQTRRG